MTTTPKDAADLDQEVEELIQFATDLVGDEARVRTWIDMPLEALGGKTARQLVRAGHAQGVRDYIESVLSGTVG